MSSVLCQARRNAFRSGHPLVRLRLPKEYSTIPRPDANLFAPLPHDTLFVSKCACPATGEFGVSACHVIMCMCVMVIQEKMVTSRLLL